MKEVHEEVHPAEEKRRRGSRPQNSIMCHRLTTGSQETVEDDAAVESLVGKRTMTR